MLLLLVHLAVAADPTPAAEPPPAAHAPSGRVYLDVVHVPAQVVAPPVGPFTPEQRVANVSGVVMDRFGVIREIRGAAPVLYVDGMRVIGTGPRR